MTNNARGRTRRGLAILLTIGLLTTVAGTSTASAATRKACKKGFVRNKAKKCVRKSAATTKKATTAKPVATTAKPATATKGVLKLGQLYSKVTSSGGATLNESFKLAQAWQDDVNSSGGINGYKVQIISKEAPANDTARMVNGMKEVEKAGALAFVASDSPNGLPAMVSYLNDKQIPYIEGTPYADETDFDPMVFPTGASEYAGRYGQVAAARDIGAKKFMNAYCSEVAACAGSVPVTAEAARREGLQHVAQAASAVAVDYTSVCISARNQGVDFFQSNGLTFANVVRDCARQGYHPAYAQGGRADQSVIESAKGEVIAGNLFEPGIWYNGPEVARLRSLLAKTDLSFNSTSTAPTQTSMQGYMSLMMVEAIMKRLTVSNPTRADFLNAMYTIKGETLGGLTFPIDYSVQKPGTGLHASNDCWVEYIVKDDKFYVMDKSGGASSKLTWICGTGHTYTIKKP